MIKFEEKSKNDLNDLFKDLKEQIILTMSENKKLLEENEKKYIELKQIQEEIEVVKQRKRNIPSIKTILVNEFAYISFLNFSKTKKNEESCLFFRDVQLYKDSKINANDIFQKYFQKNSPYQLNITNDHIKDVTNKINNPTKDMFNSILAEVENNMLDTYFQFILTDIGDFILNALE
jgi:regulator of replication initiation timing